MSTEERIDSELKAHLLHLETSLLEPAIRRSRDAVAELLSDDFIEFGSSGRVFTKERLLGQIAAETPETISLTNFVLRAASEMSALVTYESIRLDEHGVEQRTLRSSFWVLRQGRWQMLFHQGTRV